MAVGGLAGTASYGWITERVRLADAMHVGLVMRRSPFRFAFVTSALLVVLIWPQLSQIAHTDEEPEPETADVR